ncbi:hypothetical protein OH76DRAFT_830388 [Lentinus brumalis]|uniref:Uncharacterized protein n=1 Tax=Lentinus brumalis TaxID=2498619 RepID=A0A371D1V9_9APHY|nr:hypothetical protein OH76DRAFT_830388 [Polyporus brumalis]
MCIVRRHKRVQEAGSRHVAIAALYHCTLLALANPPSRPAPFARTPGPGCGQRAYVRRLLVFGPRLVNGVSCSRAAAHPASFDVAPPPRRGRSVCGRAVLLISLIPPACLESLVGCPLGLLLPPPALRAWALRPEVPQGQGGCSEAWRGDEKGLVGGGGRTMRIRLCELTMRQATRDKRQTTSDRTHHRDRRTSVLEATHPELSEPQGSGRSGVQSG